MFVRKILSTGIFVTFALATAAAPLGAQSLPQQNDQILNELRAIRQLLEKLAGPLDGRPAAGAPVSDQVKLAPFAGQAIGKADAPLTLVEFTDLQCPFCRQFHVTTYEQIKKEWIDTGKLRYISRDFPLDTIHPLAIPAAHASRCAGEQGKFWEMRHTILVNNASLKPGIFAAFAKDLKLDVAAFTACETAAPAKFRSEMQKDLADATAAGVTGTPAFVIGRATPNGIEGVRVVGAQPYAVFDARLKELLAKPVAP